MKILLATAHPYLPEIRGGAQSSMHELAVELTARGFDVAVLAGLIGKGATGLKKRLELKLRNDSLVCDKQLGYPVYRGWFPWECTTEVARRFAPDLVIMFSGLTAKMGHAFSSTGAARIAYFRNVEEDDLGAPVVGSADTYLANSQFTSKFVENRYGVDAKVIPPMIKAELYRIPTSRRYITFINPHPLKGCDIAFDLVRALPDEEFLFVDAWGLLPEVEEKLSELRRECDNVTVHEPTRDMTRIYGRTKLLIVPSRWQEAWGRVASEAQFSGIPVIATAIGGLPEAVGPGGVLMPRNARSEDWQNVVKRVVNDEAEYQALSMAALEYSKRRDFREDFLLDEICEVARDTLDHYRSEELV